MNLYIITLNYCKYQLDNLNKQVNNIVVKNINLQLNNINQINNYIKLNFNYKNKIYLILKDKYIYFNNNYLLLIKNLNKYKFYKFNNNWLINYNNNNNNINQIEINNKISKKFTRIDYESNLYNKSLVFLYNNGNNKRDIVVYNNLMNKKYPTNIINIKNITINKKILISIFLDKKVGFQDIFFNKLINIDYGNNNGINITLNVYNGYNKYKFLENNIKYFLKNSKIKDCEFNFYNFENLDINIDIQSTKIRISNLKYFNNLNFDYNFIIDNSHILDCKEIFKKLYMQNKDLCVPYLYQEKTKWSNFWLDYDENGYYLYNDNYENILNLNVKNIIKIPYFYGTILINKSIFEVYDISEAYNNNLWSIGDYDMAFCSNLRHNEIDINLLCDIKYGRILKLNEIKKYWDKNYSDIYLLKDSRIDWCNKYLSKNILENIDNLSKIKYSEYITDLFDFNFFTAKFCEELIYICEDYNNWYMAVHPPARSECEERMRGSRPSRIAASRNKRSTATLGRTLPSLIVNINASAFASVNISGFILRSLLSNVGMQSRLSLLHLVLLSVP